MKIIISFDSCTQEEILSHAKQFESFYTHISLGTAPLYKYGTTLINQIKEGVPKKPIIVKLRVADYVKNHAQFFSSLGVHAITATPGINKTMLHAACVATHEQNMKIILEIFDITYINQAITDAKTLGVDAVLFHHAPDKDNPQNIQEQLDFIKENINIPVYLETTISTENLNSILQIQPDGLVLKEELITGKHAEEILREFQHKNNN